jgi:hypothetical protein
MREVFLVKMWLEANWSHFTQRLSQSVLSVVYIEPHLVTMHLELLLLVLVDLLACCRAVVDSLVDVGGLSDGQDWLWWSWGSR